MQQKDKDALMRNCATKEDTLGYKGYDSKIDKARDESKHNDGVAHRKNVLDDPV